MCFAWNNEIKLVNLINLLPVSITSWINAAGIPLLAKKVDKAQISINSFFIVLSSNVVYQQILIHCHHMHSARSFFTPKGTAGVLHSHPSFSTPPKGIGLLLLTISFLRWSHPSPKGTGRGCNRPPHRFKCTCEG